MKKLFIVWIVSVMMCSSFKFSYATTITLDETVANSIGALATNSEAQIGYGSWQANGTSKSSLYLSPSLLFGKSVTVSDLLSISWYTKKAFTSNYD